MPIRPTPNAERSSSPTTSTALTSRSATWSASVSTRTRFPASSRRSRSAPTPSSRPWSEAARHPGAFPPAGDAFSELEQLFLEGDGGRFRAVGRAELGEEDREALLDGTGADAEELGDVVVRESARD